ncbi:hypothetical protein F4801DRAFT_598028 [Xylaria longipes]|nr:hypothetical protein F4801DRAFT_598028 [Xylaria longipes]
MSSMQFHQLLPAGAGPYTSSGAASLVPITGTRPDSNPRTYCPVPQHDISTAPEFPIKPKLSEVKEVNTSPPKASTRGPGWTWEYILLTLSASAMISLVAVLTYMHNLRLSDWRGPISPNTTISILAAISRASLGFAISSCIGQAKWNWFRKRSDSLLAFDRFDDASRGPWGSLWLIVWVKARHWVAIGAAVTIVLLTFEPFLQSIISFSGRAGLANIAYEAKISRSVYLDVGTYGSDGLTDALGFTSRPDFGMVAAINNAFFYSPSTMSNQTASFICPTANCTWIPTITLAICSACNDVTRHLTTRKLGMDPEFPFTHKSLPYLNLSNYDMASGATKGSVWIAGTRITNPQATISLRNLNSMITAVGIIKAADSYGKGDLTWDDTPVTATECALYFCTQAINSSVIAGELVEEKIKSWSDRDYSSYVGITDIGGWNNRSFYDIESGGYDVRSDLVLVIPPEDVQRLHLPENVTTRFNLTQNTVASTVAWVNEDFFAKEMQWPHDGVHNAPSVIQALYQSTNLTATFDKVAGSLTNWMRDASGTAHYGTAQDWVVFIEVKWPYITVPLLACSMGLAFCLHTIFETRKLGLQPWKTDLIAMFTHSVDAETRAQLRQAHKNGDVHKVAKAMMITFEEAESELELKTKQA